MIKLIATVLCCVSAPLCLYVLVVVVLPLLVGLSACLPSVQP
jgi:hypothetical protein